MTEIRKGAIEEIYRDLDKRLLTRHAFKGTFNTRNELVKLVYIDNPEYYFIAESKQNSWITHESPGYFLNSEERYNLNDISQVRGRITSWVDRIIEELTLSSRTSEESIEQLRKNLDKYAEELPNPNEPFGVEEAKEWTQRLDEIITRMEQLEEENKIQKGFIRQLQNDFNELKQKILTTPKKTWVKSAGNKLLNFLEIAATTTIKALAEGFVKGLLPGGS
jgi:hypothetical protein